MKHLLTFFALFLLFSCSSNERGAGNFEKLTFTLDTVVVDPGDEIINLKYGIWLSTLSPDKKILYNFDRDQTVFEKIDLEKLVLQEKIPFEKEGPNGTGEYLSGVHMNKDNHFQLSSFEGTGIFTVDGQKTRAFKLRDETFEGNQLKEGEEFSSDLLISEDGNTIVSLIRSWSEKGYALGVLDYETKALKRHELEDFDRIQAYQVMTRSGNGVSISAQKVEIQEHLEKYLISNSISNTLVLYDPQRDSLSYIKYDNQLTENSKSGKYRNEVDSHEERYKEYLLISQEINFMAPVWDEQSERFYRFSYKLRPADASAETDAPAKADVFMTILDAQYNVLAENKVDALQKRPAKHFVKDGKIWMYENIDDELGFVRISLK